MKYRPGTGIPISSDTYQSPRLPILLYTYEVTPTTKRLALLSGLMSLSPTPCCRLPSQNSARPLLQKLRC